MPDDHVPYAGFLVRLAAGVLDAIILFTVGMSLFFIQMIAFPVPITPESLGLDFGMNSTTLGALLISLLIVWGSILIVVSWLYSAGLESSRFRGTVGKQAVNLIVCDTEFRRITFLQASLRFIGKILSAVPCFLGFFLIAFTEKKQGLDDYVAGTLVVHAGESRPAVDSVLPEKGGRPVPPVPARNSNLAWIIIIGCILVIFLGPLVLAGFMLMSYHPSGDSGQGYEDPFDKMRVNPANAGIWDPEQGSAAVQAPVLWTRAAARTAFQPRSSYTLTVFRNKFWVIGGTSLLEVKNDVWYSGDGSNWTLATASAPFCPRYAHAAVVYDNRLWVIGGFGEAKDGSFRGRLNDVWYTEDGVTWTEATPSAGFSPRHFLSAASFAGRLWVAGGTGNNYETLNDIWSSADGKTWTMETGDAPFVNRSSASLLEYDSRLWILGGHNSWGPASDSWTAADGRTWTKSAVLPFTTANGQNVVALGNSLYAMQDETRDSGTRLRGLWHSDTGDQWDEMSSPPGYAAPLQVKSGVVYDEYRLATLGDRLWLFREFVDTDGTVTNDVWYAPAALLAGQAPLSRFMASTTYGPSPLSVTFTDFSLNRPDHWTWDFGDGAASAEKNPGHVFTNPGSYSVRLTAGNAFGNQTSSRTIVVDAPVTAGKTWTLVQPYLPFDERENYGMAELNGKMWLAGGWNPGADYNDVWYSADGITWTAATRNAAFSPRSAHGFLSYQGRLFVIGGLTHNSTGFYKRDEVCNNDVWSSADGITWTLETAHAAFPPRCDPASLVYDNKMWVIGGRGIRDGKNPADEYNDVWYSADGVTWVRATPSSALTPRDDAAAFVFDNAMWVFGSQSTQSELWRSRDGITWVPVKPVQDVNLFSGPVPVALVHGGRIWLIQDASWGSGSAKPVWYSDDGTNWTRFSPEFSSPSHRGSYITSGILFNNRMWIISNGEVWQSGM